jgi:hypothetical protein
MSLQFSAAARSLICASILRQGRSLRNGIAELQPSLSGRRLSRPTRLSERCFAGGPWPSLDGLPQLVFTPSQSFDGEETRSGNDDDQGVGEAERRAQTRLEQVC